ncbi:MAG: hypothetical protein JNL24_07715 [Bacteroidia bacterium]|nr:hypothetical protein [Bacteroidia bacterium]
MTTIYCSNKLKDFIGPTNLKSYDNLTPNKLGDWNAHIFVYGRRKNLILINNISYYTLIFPNIKKADFKNFEDLFIKRLSDQLLFDNIIEIEHAPILKQRLLPVKLTTTNNDRKALGTMNEYIFSFRLYMDFFELDSLDLNHINGKLNDTLVGASRPQKRDYGRPIEDMKNLMKTIL